MAPTVCEQIAVPTITALAAARVFDQLLRGKSPHTQRAYRQDVSAFAAWRKEESAMDALADLLSAGKISAGEMVSKWQGRMAKAGDALNSINRRVSTLKAFVARAEFNDVVDWRLRVDGFRDLTPEQRKNMSQRDMSGPSPAQMKKVRAALAADRSLRGIRDRAIIALLESPALRRSEVASLNVGDVDADRGTVTIIGKGRKQSETLPVPGPTLKEVCAWMDVRGGTRTSPLFVGVLPGNRLGQERIAGETIFQMTIRRGAEGGLRGRRMRPHGLRHAGVTNIAEVVAEQGLPITEGMKLSRHKKLETFQRYLDRVGTRGRDILEAAARKGR